MSTVVHNTDDLSRGQILHWYNGNTDKIEFSVRVDEIADGDEFSCKCTYASDEVVGWSEGEETICSVSSQFDYPGEGWVTDDSILYHSV